MFRHCMQVLFVAVLLALAAASGGCAGTESGHDGSTDTLPDGGLTPDGSAGDAGALADVPAVTLKLVEGCNPFATSKECILPYPSHWFEQPAEGSPTGVRVNYPANSVPGTDGGFDLTGTNTADGVSPVGPIIMHFGKDINAGQLVPESMLASSVAADAPIAL
ncbi:MAG: hypothetical protein WC889_20370, partial [Myxococcota bacterium]